MTETPPPQQQNGNVRDRVQQRLLRVATWGQTLVQESTEAQPSRLVHELAIKPGALEEALALTEAWRAFGHPAIHALSAASVTQPAGSPGEVLRLERPMPRGTPLAQVLAKVALDEVGVSALFCDLAKGLAAVHAQRLVVGNLGLDTLLLCPPGQDEAAPLLLVDAGLPALVAAASGPLGEVGGPRHGQLLPQPEVVAPEVLAGQALTAAADVFALCAVVGGALLGRPVFASATTAGLRAAMAQGVAQSEAIALAQAGPHLAPILLRGLAGQAWARAGVLSELITAMVERTASLPTTLADDFLVIALWSPGSPLIALAAYASAVPWSAQFAESTLLAAPTVGASDPVGQAKLRAALDSLELERSRSQAAAERRGRNLLSQLIILALFGLIAAAIAASAVRNANRAQAALNPQPVTDTRAPLPIRPMPKPRVLFKTPQE